MKRHAGAAALTESDVEAARVQRELLESVADREKLSVVQAPPGSGKTYLLLKAVEHAWKCKLRVAVATQTNAQADDICRRISVHYPKLCATRFAGSGSAAVELGDNILWATSKHELPGNRGPCVVVGTAAKWGLVDLQEPFDVLFIEEAWQLSWADFMLLGQVASRFVLIGDPGQISPVVTIDVARWETAPRPPHEAAPRVILSDSGIRAAKWSLPASRRLPSDSVSLVKAFYDFDFGSFAAPGERQVMAIPGRRSGQDKAIDLLADGSVVGLTLPTPDGGPPLEEDQEVADAASGLVQRLLNRRATYRMNGMVKVIEPTDIGLCATHRAMNGLLELALPAKLKGKVQVDTAERWQGLERPVMIVIHPLSGVLYPSKFDLETGRLCVMASRHQAGLIVMGRDHITETLDDLIPSAEQPVGKPDVAGRGHWDNLHFWRTLASNGRIVSAA